MSDLERTVAEVRAAQKCDHLIGTRTIGGFPGHEHVHPSGPQVCFRCNKMLDELLDAAYARGQADENEALEQTATGFGVGLTANCRDDRAYNKAVQEIAGAIRARRAPQAETEG